MYMYAYSAIYKSLIVLILDWLAISERLTLMLLTLAMHHIKNLPD